MRILVPLTYQHIRPTEDVDHMGEAYTPTERDHAQEFRNRLLQRFAEMDQGSFAASDGAASVKG
jgi:hypothetical protein